MMLFIKYDKYLSFINIVIVICFLIFNSAYYWFLILELTVIMIYLLFMLYRFYLRSKVKEKEIEKINELKKFSFKYENYNDIYEEEDDFDLEMVSYEKLLEVLSINFLRMDSKLDIVDYSIVDEGLKHLEKNIKKNNNRKKDYEFIKECIEIIKKYYNDKCIRKDNIKKHKKLISLLIVLSIISLSLLVIYFVFNKIGLYSIIASVFIIIMIVANLIVEHINK